MSVTELAQHQDRHCSVIAQGLINLLEKGLITPSVGTVEEAVADLRQQIATGNYR
jgi:predicted transcriptional regulator